MPLIVSPEVANTRGKFRVVSDALSVSSAVINARWPTSHGCGHGIVDGLGWIGVIRGVKV